MSRITGWVIAMAIDMWDHAAMQQVSECCAPLTESALDPDQAARLAGWFRVLGDPARLRLLSLIASLGEACAACDLVEPLGVSQPTVSHHLKVLHQAGLVDREKRGRWVYYRAVPARLDILGRALIDG
jgi:ArsR family transcriptional regulator